MLCANPNAMVKQALLVIVGLWLYWSIEHIRSKHFNFVSQFEFVKINYFKRWRIRLTVCRHPQFSVQAWSAPRPSLHLLGQARLGPVLLQGGLEGGDRPDAQEPASLHHHEPNRSQSGATNFSRKEKSSGTKVTILLTSDRSRVFYYREINYAKN